MNKQKEDLAARLAARKRKSKLLSAAPASGETTKPIFEVDEELSTTPLKRQATLQPQRGGSPMEKKLQVSEREKGSNSMSPEVKRLSLNQQEPLNLTKEIDVSSSHNRSTTTVGAGLASKIGQSMTRII